ncbi:MAG TPA: RHS repeat-associated core domain-containing protein [Phycisphaerae bacterium]|nr:RHS repeat-associated core domain-containing protein [Phycisphaerae bacterium]HNU44158.1 RHS repeat-associated core domain-containing protein [Phycisphaerae bacterium]
MRVESDAGGVVGTTAFTYDDRGRLLSEWRTRDGGMLTDYHYVYAYDQVGNRTVKTTTDGQGQVLTTEYHYDVEAPATYGSNNNRLMYAETFDELQTPRALVSTTWYYYVTKRSGVTDIPLGNIERVVTKAVGSEWYEAKRFVYAQNLQAVAYVMGEKWQWDGQSPPTQYAVTFIREFRYDGARERYLNRALNPGNPSQVLSSTWTDYDGDEPYGDYTVSGGSVSPLRSFELGIGTVDPWAGAGGASTSYYHGDLIGTTRLLSGPAGEVSPGTESVYTAFGEPISGANHRYGYAGAWGYQADDVQGAGGADFPYLHVGHRYYDPSIGRFLQRDPIGIFGGLNVYAYGRVRPTSAVDPNGTYPLGALQMQAEYNGLRAMGKSPEEAAQMLVDRTEAEIMFTAACFTGVAVGAIAVAYLAAIDVVYLADAAAYGGIRFVERYHKQIWSVLKWVGSTIGGAVVDKATGASDKIIEWWREL